MLFPDFILIKVLYIVVDTGLVEGQSATITPMAMPMSTIDLSLS